VPVQPFLGAWEFVFRSNASLPRSTWRGYSEEDRQHLLATLVPITWPITDEWTRDLFGLIESMGSTLGKVVLDSD